MSFKAVWGFDPDEVIKAQRAWRAEPDIRESMSNEMEEHAARVPVDVYSQIYELRRMFRL